MPNISRHLKARIWRVIDRPVVQLYLCALCMFVLLCLPAIVYSFIL